MMRQSLSTLLLLVSLATCGGENDGLQPSRSTAPKTCCESDDPELPEATEMAGSCDMLLADPVAHICVEYSGREWTPETVRSNCEWAGNAYLAAACPTIDRVGGCVVQAGETHERLDHYYSDVGWIEDAQDAASVCAVRGGQFVP